MVALFSKNDKEALICVKVERTSYKRKLKKSDTEGLTSNDRAAYSVV